MKSIKTLKKKNEKKKQKNRKRRAKSDININYIKKKSKDRSKFSEINLNTFKNVVIYAVFLNNLITFSIIDKIINKFIMSRII